MGNKYPYVAGLYHFFMRQVDINNKPSWVRSVKTLLSRKGFGDVWVNQGVGDIDIFMNIFKQRLIDTFRQEWHGRLQESSRARFYRVVKPQHQLSKYLQCHGWPSTQPGSLHTALQRKYTQPCSLFSRGTAVWTMGARLCQQWGTAVCKCPAV